MGVAGWTGVFNGWSGRWYSGLCGIDLGYGHTGPKLGQTHGPGSRVSPGHFDKLVREGVMPSPRHLSGVDVWLRQELDDALFGVAPKDTAGGLSSCDDAFGL